MSSVIVLIIVLFFLMFSKNIVIKIISIAGFMFLLFFLLYLFYLKYIRPLREVRLKREKDFYPSPEPKTFKEKLDAWEPPIIRPPMKIGKYVLNKKYAYDDVVLNGVPANLIFEFDMLNKPIELVPEPTNEFDADAIAVKLDDIFIGYIPKNQLQSMIHDYNSRNQPVYSIISNIDLDDDTALIERISIFLGFYYDPYANLDKCDTLSAKLVKTSKKDFFDSNRQENYDIASKGDYVNLEYYSETRSYIVSVGGSEIGETSAFITKKLQDFDNTCNFIGIIDEIIENYETERFGAKIIIYLKEI